MSNERASIFDEAEIDLSDFQPKAPATTPRPRPDKAAIRKAAEARGFASREPERQPEPPTAPLAPVAATSAGRGRVRRRVTGRNQQFNIKATADAIERFYAINDAKGWVLGETFENAIAALERELGAGEGEASAREP